MYIKTKKVWKVFFNKKELKIIFNAFKNNSLAYTKEWETSDKSQFIEFTTKYGLFIHPETDLEDNSMGIQPEQIRDFSKHFKLEDLEKLLFILNITAQRSKYIKQNFLDSDGFIVWEKVWNTFVRPHLTSGLSINELLDLVSRRIIKIIYSKKINIFYSFAENFFETISENPFLIIYALDYKWCEKYKVLIEDKHFISKDSVENFLIEQSNEWKKIGLNPKSNILKAARAGQFDKDSLFVIESLFGNKNIGELSMIDQYYAVSLIDFFGKKLKEIPINLLEKGKIDILIGLEPNYLNEISNIKDIIDLIGDLLTAQQFVNYTKYINLLGNEFLIDLGKEENKEMFKETFNLFIELEENTFSDKIALREFLKDLKPRWLKYVKRFYKKSVTLQNIRDLYNIWNLRSKNQTLPIIKNKFNSYTYSLMDKTIDKESLFIGFATDCCQVPTMTGVACMKSGLSNPEETFFSVTKKGKIYAQSWVWTGIDSKKRKFICFDSIEVLGKDLEEMPDILNSYKELCRILFEEHGFDYAITGADGEKIPRGLANYCVKHVEKKDFESKGIVYRGSCTYTDINELGIYIFDKKKGK